MMKKILSLFLFLILCISTAIAAQDHYLERAVSDRGEANAWRHMPVSVYVQRHPYAPLVIEAFQTWQNSLGGLIRFTLANSPSTANINVVFVNQLPGSVVGLTTNQTSNGKIISSKVQLLAPQYIPSKSNFIYSVALHEIGHALGINGHSSSKGDIMYPSSLNVKERQQLSARDIKTIKWLYTVKQETLDKYDTQLKGSKIAEAEAYVRKFPTSSVGWSNLGVAYAQNKMFSKAELAYKKALQINPNAHSAYRNLAIVYANQKKYPAAFNAAKKTYSLNPTFENLQFVSDFVYNAESKAQMRQLYNSYARKNPNSKHAKELNKIRRDSIF